MSPRRGFAFLEILLVLAILLILVGGYSHFGGFGDGPDRGTAEMTLDRAGQTACQVSRAAIATNIQIWQSTHPGTPITPQSLEEAGINMRCPHSRRGGEFVLVNGELFCTDHDPPPAQGPAISPSAPPVAPSATPPALGNLLQGVQQTQPMP